MSAITWMVYPDSIPLDGRPKELGTVSAPDKTTALDRAKHTHGQHIIVQSVSSRNVAVREQLPIKPAVTREERALRSLRARMRKPKPEPTEQLPIGERPGDYQRAKSVSERHTRRTS